MADKAGKRRRPRTCVGCREESPKRAMLRIARTPEGEVVIDPTGKLSGRGAYVCLREECVLAAEKRDGLSKSLKAPADGELYAQLLELVRSTPGKGTTP